MFVLRVQGTNRRATQSSGSFAGVLDLKEGGYVNPRRTNVRLFAMPLCDKPEAPASASTDTT